MPFTGKATYSAGPSLPEIAEDVSDLVGIVSPYETPLLDHLADPSRAATSTVHEWLEDELLPNTDSIEDDTIANPTSETTFGVVHGDRFRPGDQIKRTAGKEIMLVTAVNVPGNALTVARGYGGTTPEAIDDGDALLILGNAALEGDDAPTARFTTRVRRSNFTQIFTATVEVSGSDLAARQAAVKDEMDYQTAERLRELLRDLENTVINGVAPVTNPQGGATTRRTMRGLLSYITSHTSDAAGAPLDEPRLNAALRTIWEESAGTVDTIVVSGFQKRKINGFMTASRAYTPQSDKFRDLVSVYESDFGVCRVLLSRAVPADAVLLLDSGRIDVLPLAGRSFHSQPLATVGDRKAAQLIGEYTLEMRNENAHGVIRGLATA